jgi:hypothetical protein
MKEKLKELLQIIIICTVTCSIKAVFVDDYRAILIGPPLGLATFTFKAFFHSLWEALVWIFKE